MHSIKKRFSFFFLTFGCILVANIAKGQNIIDDLQTLSPNGGQITVHQEAEVARLFEVNLSSNKTLRGKIQGYRIQLYSDYGSNARQKALDVRERFTRLFPGYDYQRIYIFYEPPFVKVRIGDYRDEHAALQDYKRIVKEFPECYIVNSEIEFPPLNE
ncbi:MAG TPA: SPOR domain-containing protein [Salinivirgaceae bacterium]|nr:SPOR domain-containing protein [Salinivirgaceae bacterium]